MVLTDIDQLWVADITYIRLQVEFVYLAVLLDAFSPTLHRLGTAAHVWKRRWYWRLCAWRCSNVVHSLVWCIIPTGACNMLHEDYTGTTGTTRHSDQHEPGGQRLTTMPERRAL